MPSSLTANMLTEMKEQCRVYPVVEITLGGTVYKFAEQAVASASQGVYKPFLSGMSGFSRNANSTQYSLEIPNPTITIFDQDRVLQKLIGGPIKGNIKGSAVECYFRSNSVAAGDHYKFFDGIVQNYRLNGDRRWTFTLSPNITQLTGEPKIPYATTEDFPTLPVEFRGNPLWIVYGKHSSSGVKNTTGMIKCMPADVDAAGDTVNWICGYGQMTIQRLFFNGIEDTTNWVFYPLARGTRYYQMALFVGTGTEPLATDTITIDATGLFTSSPTDFTGGNLENPASIMRNFLAHFVYGSGDLRPGTAWESETGKPIATSIWDAAEDYFTDRNHKMSKIIYANDRVIDIFNEYCEDFNSVPMYDDQWRLGSIPENESDTTIYTDTRFISQRDNHALSELKMDTSRSEPVSEITINYLLADATSTLTETNNIEDPFLAYDVRETFDFSSGKAEAF